MILTAQGHGLTNRRFSEVTADGNTYCYENFVQGQSACGIPLGRPNGVLLISMPSPMTLRAQLATGVSCATAPRQLTTAAAEFER